MNKLYNIFFLIFFGTICVTFSHRSENGILLNNEKQKPITFGYGRKNYTVVTYLQLDAIETLHFCKSIGQDVVTLETQEENDNLFQQLNYLLNSETGTIQFWTSGNRLGVDWRWLSNNQQINITNWANSYPENYSNYNCLGLVYSKGNSSNTAWWFNYGCCNSYYIICEKSIY